MGIKPFKIFQEKPQTAAARPSSPRMQKTLPPAMNEVEEFSLLHDFLFASDPRFEPRDLSDRERKLLERIARGEATDADRDAALEILRKDTNALEYLAQQLNRN